MHLLIHTQYYPPEVGAPQARLSELAERLAGKGHTVTVLTAMPNYPAGKIQPGYGGLLRREQHGRVRVVRSAIVPSRSAGILPRLLNYFSFVVSSLYGGLFAGRADIVLTESPPLFLGIAGYLLSRLKGARWIFNVSDLWPESALRLGLIQEGFIYRLALALEKFCYRKAWLVSGQSVGILSDIQSRFPGVHTYHLSNGCDTALFSPIQASQQSKAGLGGEINVVYAGLHGLAQGLEVVIQAAGQLQNDPRLKIILIGDGPVKESLIQQAFGLSAANLEFRPAQPRESIPALLASADICIVPLGLDLPGAVPSKLYEAMASGKPVILMAAGEAAEIVRKHAAGIVVAPGDLEGLTQAFRALVDQPDLRREMGSNGRAAAVQYYDRAAIVDRFDNFLQQQIGTTAAGFAIGKS